MKKLLYTFETPVDQMNWSLTFRIDSGDAFGGADVPYADGLVSGRCDEQIWVGRMPAELIHTVTVASVVVLFHLERNKQI